MGEISPCLQDVDESPMSGHLYSSYFLNEFRPLRDDRGHVSVFGEAILTASQLQTIFPAKAVYYSDSPMPMCYWCLFNLVHTKYTDL